MLRPTLALLSLLLVSSAAAAQSAPTESMATPSASATAAAARPVAPTPAGPRLLEARVGVSAEAAAEQPVPAPAPAPGPLSQKSSTGLMVFGGAAFVTGILVGGDVGTIISIGGAGVFLYGLWTYLK